MTLPNRPQPSSAPQARDERQQAPREATPPCDYERHLEAEHNLLVDSQAGWPTGVSRYRLFRPLQGKQSEKTLVSFTGTGPAALAYFFHYIHPTPRVKPGAAPTTWRR